MVADVEGEGHLKLLASRLQQRKVQQTGQPTPGPQEIVDEHRNPPSFDGDGYDMGCGAEK